MTDIATLSQDQAVKNFQEYLKIRSVQPDPDYGKILIITYFDLWLIIQANIYARKWLCRVKVAELWVFTLTL